MSIIRKNLVDRGYRLHVNDSYVMLMSTDTLYQKCVYDEVGNKKYFINAWYYPKKFPGLPVDGVQIEAQLMDENDEHYLNVNPMTDDIDRAEKTIEDVWKNLGLGYCDRLYYGEED